jgi:hypothetical protein
MGDLRCISKLNEIMTIKFYGNNFDYTQYKGFDAESETQDLCNAFTDNITYYSYDDEKNSYKLESLIQSSNTEKETPIVNIYFILVQLSMET